MQISFLTLITVNVAVCLSISVGYRRHWVHLFLNDCFFLELLVVSYFGNSQRALCGNFQIKRNSTVRQ